MADAQIAIIDGDQTQVVLAPGENPAIVTSIPGPQGPAGAGVPLGGTTNQVLFKQSGTNYDTAWGPITSAMIGDLEIVNADVSASAAIAGTKISPNFGSQNVITTGTSTAASFIPSSSTVPTNGLYLSAANSVALSTNGNGRLFVNSDGSIQFGNPSATRLQVAATSAIGDSLYSYSSNYYIWGFRNESNSLTIESAFGGNIIFKAKQDGVASSPGAATERLRITSTGQLSHIGAGSSGSPAVSFSGSAPSNSLVVASNGQVAMGTSSPSYPLHVVGSIFAKSGFRVGSNYSAIDVETGASGLYLSGAQGALNHVFINPSGRVGIGTSAPAFSTQIGSTPFSTEVTTSAAGSTLGLIGGSYGAPVSGVGLFMSAGLGNGGTICGINAYVVGSGAVGSYTTDLRISSKTSHTHVNTDIVTVTGAGRVGIGTTSPAAKLHVDDGTGCALFVGLSSNIYYRAFEHIFQGQNGTNERFRCDSSGRLLVGTPSARSNFFNSTVSALSQVEEVGGATACYSAITNVAGATGPAFIFGKTRGGSAGSNTVVVADDGIGALSFQGSDGTEFVEAATIRAFVDGTPGANDMPGRIVLSTTADGAASPTERLRITSTGQVRLAGAGITFNGDTATANELDDYEEGTWTPIYSGTWTTTPTNASARYTKIGRFVHIAFSFTGGAKSSATSGWVTGLPFTPQSATAAGGGTGRLSDTGISDRGLIVVYDSRIFLTSTTFDANTNYCDAVYTVT